MEKFCVLNYDKSTGGEKMNQVKTGQFLKDLRKEKGVTQEQLAEVLGVSNRSISRWENGVNMPDLDLLVELAKYYDVEIGEILDGERKVTDMDKKTEDTLMKVAEYNNEERSHLTKRINIILSIGLIGIIVFAIIDLIGLSDIEPYKFIAEFSLGFSSGLLIVGAVVTSRYGAKIRAFKSRSLKRNNG